MLPINPEVPMEYTPKCDKDLPLNDRTVFLLRVPHPKKVATLKDELYQEQGFGKKSTKKFLMGTFEYEMLKLSLVGWKNFRIDGKDVKFDWIEKADDKICSPNNLCYLPAGIRTELFNFIQGTEEEPEEEEESTKFVGLGENE